jgi:hypothetical protein
MSNPTTPFSWQMPTATDLVTDLPADFEVFGQAVATSMADLLGGTTGQVLSKTSNTDMDFTWVTSDDANAIQNTIVDAKGDLIGATAADTPARLAVGTNGQVLTADSSAATGLAWATPTPTGRKIVQIITGSTSTQTGSSSATYADTTLTATITPTLASSQILVFVTQAGCQKFSSNTSMGLRLVRGATTILQMANAAGGTGSTVEINWGTIAATYLDSPATTSATTYKTQFNSTAGSSQTTVQHNTPTSTIVLMEVSV